MIKFINLIFKSCENLAIIVVSDSLFFIDDFSSSRTLFVRKGRQAKIRLQLILLGWLSRMNCLQNSDDRPDPIRSGHWVPLHCS